MRKLVNDNLCSNYQVKDGRVTRPSAGALRYRASVVFNLILSCASSSLLEQVYTMLVWALTAVAVALLAALAASRWYRDENYEKLPGPPGYFLVANALDFVMDPVKLFYYFRTLANTYKDSFKLNLGFKKCVVICNPEDVETLISGVTHNTKGFLYKFMEPWLQEGLLLSDGSKWHHRRKILTPAFHFNILRHFTTVLEENSRRLAEELQTEVARPRTDIGAFTTEFALHSICETAMGTRLDDGTTDIGKSYKEGIYKLGSYVVYRSQRVWMYPNLIFPYTLLGMKQKKLLHLMYSFRDHVVDKRRDSNDFQNLHIDVSDDEMGADSKKRLAMLDLLLQAERDGTIDSKGVGEEVDTFMFEGHDTTATALTFMFMLLANHEQVQNKILEECRSIFGSSSRPATMNDLAQMKYLECCIKESLRLYPPVHFIMRKSAKPIKLKNNVEVPGNVEYTVLIYDLQRRSDQFPEPLQFRPERFAGAPTWHPYAYIPFSAGPRNCIGQKFAMIEMKLAVSAVLRRFRLGPVTRPQDVVFTTDFILRPKHPIYVKLEQRE